jgi:hypothetical protein
MLSRPLRRLLLAAAPLVLAGYVALGYRDAGPSPSPVTPAALARAEAMDGEARREELRAVLELERAVAARQGEENADPRLVEAAARAAALAEAGFPPAAWRTAWYYMNGWGLERDRCAALEWLYRAARAGEPSAQFWLALSYLPPNGRGVAPDKLEAFRWATAARDQGLPLAVDLFHFFTRDLSPEERAAAEASLAGWTPTSARPPAVERFPYVPLLVGLWPRQTHHVMPCRQPLAPYEDWPGD